MNAHVHVFIQTLHFDHEKYIENKMKYRKAIAVNIAHLNAHFFHFSAQ